MYLWVCGRVVNIGGIITAYGPQSKASKVDLSFYTRYTVQRLLGIFPLSLAKESSPAMGLIDSVAALNRHRIKRLHVGLRGLKRSSGSGGAGFY